MMWVVLKPDPILMQNIGRCICEEFKRDFVGLDDIRVHYVS